MLVVSIATVDCAGGVGNVYDSPAGPNLAVMPTALGKLCFSFCRNSSDVLGQNLRVGTHAFFFNELPKWFLGIGSAQVTVRAQEMSCKTVSSHSWVLV